MKTLVKTLFASALIAVFLTSATVTAFASGPQKHYVKVASPFTFHRIEVTGNVIVVVSQKSKEEVAIEGYYNRSRTSIKRQGYTLIINSTEIEPVTIHVSVIDLQRIDASNTAIVRTEGKMNVKYLQVFLKDEARADVTANTESLYTHISGNANLKLSGSTQDHTVLKDRISKLTLQDFIASKSTVDSIKAEILVASKIR